MSSSDEVDIFQSSSHFNTNPLFISVPPSQLNRETQRQDVEIKTPTLDIYSYIYIRYIHISRQLKPPVSFTYRTRTVDLVSVTDSSLERDL